jgi:hypothetical protein
MLSNNTITTTIRITMTLTMIRQAQRRQRTDIHCDRSLHQSLRHRCLRRWGYFWTAIKIIRALSSKTFRPALLAASPIRYSQSPREVPKHLPAMKW